MRAKQAADEEDLVELEDEVLEQDIEDEKSLDADEEPVVQYERMQRELVTQALDFDLSSLAQRVENETIDLNPRYQRRTRWARQRQSRLIESFLMNVPVPPIYLAEDKYGQYSVIDGQQRLRAIHDFFNGVYALTGLKVFPELNGRRLRELPPDIRKILEVRPSLRCIVILKQSSPDIKFDVFDRLNTGGVSLNQQEIRNNAYRGRLNDLILELSELRLFRRMLKIKNERTSATVKHMRDCELVLRFFALRKAWKPFKGSMRRTLNKYMEDNQYAGDAKVTRLRDLFVATLKAVDAAFGDKAFVRWGPEAKQWSRGVVAGLYDAEMLACVGKDPATLVRKRPFILRQLQEAFEDAEFDDAVRTGTNQPSKLRLRVQRVQSIIDQAIGD